MILWRTHPLILAVMVGCAGIPHAVRVETRQGKAVVHIPRTADVQQVVVEEAEFRQAMKRLAREVRLTGTPRQTAEKMFQLDPLSGNYLYLLRDRKPAVPTSWRGLCSGFTGVAPMWVEACDAYPGPGRSTGP